MVSAIGWPAWQAASSTRPWSSSWSPSSLWEGLGEPEVDGAEKDDKGKDDAGTKAGEEPLEKSPGEVSGPTAETGGKKAAVGGK